MKGSTLAKSNWEKAYELFKPDENGISDWVKVEKFPLAGLNWTSNGNIRHGAPWKLTNINWEINRVGGPNTQVLALKMNGWKNEDSFDQIINAEIKNKFNGNEVCNISLMPATGSNRELDHRFGNKNHPDYVEKYKKENQTENDFQIIHRALNMLKRQICKQCVDSGVRPAHPIKGFVEGNEKLANNFPCRGCYLAEPEKYR